MLITGEVAEQLPTTVLVVCTANICRSPLAQQTLRTGLREAGWLADIAVVSAGANAEENLSMCEVSATQLTDEAGTAFATAHRSKALTRQMVAGAGIVLTAVEDLHVEGSRDAREGGRAAHPHRRHRTSEGSARIGAPAALHAWHDADAAE